MQRPYFRGIESSSFSISFTFFAAKSAVAAWSVAVAETKEAEAVGLRSFFDQDFSPSALEMSPGISGSTYSIPGLGEFG